MKKFGEEKVYIIGIVLILFIFVFTIARPSLRKIDIKKALKKLSNDEGSSVTYDSNSLSSTNLNTITSEKLNELQLDGNILIIDLRSTEDYRASHIVDSVSVPMNSSTQIEVSKALDSNNSEYIVFVGYGADIDEINNFLSGNLSLTKDNVYILSGGYTSWKKNELSSVTLGQTDSFTDQLKVSYLEMNKLNEMITTGHPVLIIDVSNFSDFDRVHIKSASNIPLNQLELARDNIPTGVDIIVYGKNQKMAFQAGVILYDLNYFTVRVLEGGIDDWINAGYPIESINP